VEIAPVVIVLHGQRFPLGSGEAATLDSFLNVPGLTVARLRGRLRGGGEGDIITITDDAERDALQAALEAASQDQRYFTGALPALLEAARKPTAGP